MRYQQLTGAAADVSAKAPGLPAFRQTASSTSAQTGDLHVVNDYREKLSLSSPQPLANSNPLIDENHATLAQGLVNSLAEQSARGIKSPPDVMRRQLEGVLADIRVAYGMGQAVNADLEKTLRKLKELPEAKALLRDFGGSKTFKTQVKELEALVAGPRMLPNAKERVFQIACGNSGFADLVPAKELIPQVGIQLGLLGGSPKEMQARDNLVNYALSIADKKPLPADLKNDLRGLATKMEGLNPPLTDAAKSLRDRLA